MPQKGKVKEQIRKTAKASAAAKPKKADAGDQQQGSCKPLARRREREDDGQDTGAERAARRRRTSRNTDGSEPKGTSKTEDDLPLSPRQSKSLDDDLLDEEMGRETEKYLDAVVKVFCVHSEPNFSLPWQRKRQVSSTSSGFIISGKRILTNAHSVDHHTQVKVRRRGSDAKFIAKVLAQGPECDIALLFIEDEAFWEGGGNPVQFGKLPRLQDSVAVIGYPIGGDSISVSSGVVSRIEVTNYSHGATALLGMQIDAAINSGNSGGPAFNRKGECVGIAFQSLKSEDAENIGYVIPVDVVQHFIIDFDKNQKFTSFPILGIDWQKLESPYLRTALGMKVGQKGVLVREVEPTAAAAAQLQKGDVILSFDGTSIANDGTIRFSLDCSEVWGCRSGERISFSYLVSRKFTNDKAVVEILRKGKPLTTELKLSAHRRLIPEHLDQRPPSYLVIAGFVFTQVTTPYLRSEYGKDYDFDAPVKLLDVLLHGKAKNSEQQIVVLGHVLAAECTVGYEELQNYQVFKVNGGAINNLRDLVKTVDSCTERFLTFELQYNATVVIDTKIARAATTEIMAMHYIAHDRSADLRAEQ